MTPRKRVISLNRIEGIIAAGQRRGLTATSVSHYPDGQCVIHFGGSPVATQTQTNIGWEDV